MESKKCYDCGKPIGTIGITVGRISCAGVWASICLDCVEKLPCSQKEKKEMLKQQMIINELVRTAKIK